LFAQQNYYQKGKASYYADSYEGHITASGEVYQANKLTAAHPNLSFGTFVKVTNLENNKSVIVIINDRGPYTGNRLIDVSKKAAYKLDFIKEGTTDVGLEIVETANGNLNDMITEIPNSNNKEYYKLNTVKYIPAGFGIQIASYTEIANLMRVANNINNSIEKELTIQIVNYKGSKTYRLIIGNFKTIEDANSYRNSIQHNYPDSFVISY